MKPTYKLYIQLVAVFMAIIGMMQETHGADPGDEKKDQAWITFEENEDAVFSYRLASCEDGDFFLVMKINRKDNVVPVVPLYQVTVETVSGAYTSASSHIMLIDLPAGSETTGSCAEGGSMVIPLDLTEPQEISVTLETL